MKKHFITFWVLVMVIGMLPMSVSAQPAAHTHPVCGNSACPSHSDTAEWTAWDGSDISTAGNYYLTDNITVSGDITVSADANICLNGKTITLNAVSFGLVSADDADITICDCGPAGAITGGQYVVYVFQSDGAVTVYGGSLTGYRDAITNHGTGNIAVHGGTLTGDMFYGVSAWGSGGITITGGTISGSDYGVYNAGTGTVAISGGKISKLGNTGKMTITGGVYTYDQTIEIGQLPNGYVWTENTDEATKDAYPYTVIEHIAHTYDRENTDSKYLKSEATCTEAAVYYRSCFCGASSKGTPDEAVFTSGSANGHSYGTDWKADKENHWHECFCGDKAGQAAHTPKTVGAKEATASENGDTGDTVCSVCGYEIAKGEDIPVKGSGSDNTRNDGGNPGRSDEVNPNTDVERPKTGDETDRYPWIALLFISGFGIAGAAYYEVNCKKAENKL